MYRLQHPPPPQHIPWMGFAELAPSFPRPGSPVAPGAPQHLQPARKHPAQRAWGRGAQPALSTAAAARGGSLLRGGCQTSPGSPRDTAPSRQLAAWRGMGGGGGVWGGRQPSTALWGTREDFPPLQRQGRRRRGDPQPQSTQGSGCHGRAVPLLRERGDRLGHCGWLDTTPGTESRPTDRSGHRRESWL